MNRGQQKRRWLARALATSVLAGWSVAVQALPAGPTVVGPAGSTTFNFGSGSLTVNQTTPRAVINWSSFNIGTGETVTFAQPNAGAIAFNVVGQASPISITGALQANGGVWLFSPGGIVIGNGAVITTGSFLASTGLFDATSLNGALNSNTIAIAAPTTPGTGKITVSPSASITANAGFVALQSPDIDAEGAITATDAVVLDALDGMTVTVAPSAGGVTLQSETPVATAGGASSVTLGGSVNAGWLELDAYDKATATPGADGIINLTGHVTATGFKPGGSGDSVEILADNGSASPADLVTSADATAATIAANGNVVVHAGKVGLGAVTSSNGGVSAVAGAGGIDVTKPILASQAVDLEAQAALSVDAAVTSSNNGVVLNGDTVALGAGAQVRADAYIGVTAPDGVDADPASRLDAGDLSANGSGSINVLTGSTAGPADIRLGEVSAASITIVDNYGISPPPGGTPVGNGMITLNGAVTTSQTGSLYIDGAHGLQINAPVVAQGSSSVQIYTEAGDYGFGPNGSLSFTGTAADNPQLNINGDGYTLVFNADDLLNINSDLGGHYALAGSIDLANAPTLADPTTPRALFFTTAPIAPTSSPDSNGAFGGTFAGLGHTIANLTINQTVTNFGYASNGEAGLFGAVTGTIRDFTLSNVSVTGVGFMDLGGAVGYLSGRAQNIAVTGQVTGAVGWSYSGIGGVAGDVDNGGVLTGSHAAVQVTGSDGALVGGLAGRLSNGGAITNSYATGNVTTGGSNGFFNNGAAGGLVGGTDSYGPTSSITGSYATGAVAGGQQSVVGGLVGQTGVVSISDSYATGAVSQSLAAASNAAGGFVGLAGAGSTFSNDYASGNVSAAGATGSANTAGGFVGSMVDTASISDSYALGAVSSADDALVGGFAGSLSATVGGPGTPSIARVYATGAVTDTAGTSPTGGLVGDLAAGSVSASFWDTGTTGSAVAVGVGALGTSQSNLTGVSGAAAYQSATYSGVFDLTNTWVVFNGVTRPMLRSEASSTISNAHQLQLIDLNLAGDYTLATDIDASATTQTGGLWNPATGFSPIGGSVATPFTGSLDGQGHTISNLTVTVASGAAQTWAGGSSDGFAGLFGVEGSAGSISNVALSNVAVTGGNGVDAGGLVGLAQGAVTSVSVSGAISTGSASGSVSAAAGGVAGAATGQIASSASSANVSGGAADVGGLVGWLAAGGSITGAAATGSVTAGSGAGGQLALAGGLVGLAGSGSITLSHAASPVTAGADADAGGLVGESLNSTIGTSYASGAVQAGAAGGVASSAGGLAGAIQGGAVGGSYATGAVSVGAATTGAVGSNAGGFAGTISGTATVSGAYSTGAVTAAAATTSALTTDAGGFAGQVGAGATASGSYSESDASITSGGPTATHANAGGFAGVVGGTVSDINVTGRVQTPVGTGGGVAGVVNAGGSLTNGYWDGGIANTQTQAVGQNFGTATGLGEVGGSGPSPYLASSYGGFDFTNTWYLVAGETRPILRSEYATTIYNAHQLQLMALDPTASYQLGADIEAGETSNVRGLWNPANGFVPVGSSSSTPFSGGFDGQGHSINGLSVIQTSSVLDSLPSGQTTFGAAGLFGYSTGAISNVSLVGASVSGGDGMAVGGLVGVQISGAISNVAVAGAVTTGQDIFFGQVPVEATAGGVAGVSAGAISLSQSSASVGSAGEAHVGGLVGELQGGSITNAYATGAVSVGSYGVVGAPTAGGLVGSAVDGPSALTPSITGSFASGAVTGGTGSYAGGLVGYAQDLTATTSYATGAVTVNTPGGSTLENVGGFGGFLFDSTITQSFASGAVTVNGDGGTARVGGFAGYISGGQVSDAYASGAIDAPAVNQVGGFAGGIDAANVARVLATGDMSGSSAGDEGGLVGFINSGSLTDSYWDEGTTGQGSAGNTGSAILSATGIGGSTGNDPLQTATYGDWNFDTVWSTPNTSTNAYPLLFGVSHVVRITAQDVTMTYADFPVFVVSEYGFQPLEGSSLVSGLTGGPTNTSVSSSGNWVVTTFGTPYPIEFSGAAASSPNGSGAYQFNYVSGQLTINQRPLTTDLNTAQKTYDAGTGADPTTFGYNLPGPVGGDDVSVDASSATASYDSQNVGTSIGVTVHGLGLSGNDSQNYTVNSDIIDQPVGEIDPAPLTLTAVTDSRGYDGTIDSSGIPIVVSGLQGNDSVTDLAQVFDSRNAGPRQLLISNYTINDGNNGHNYTVTPRSVAGTITPAPLTLSAVTDGRVYDGDIDSTGTPTVSGPIYSPDTITLSQQFDSRNAGGRQLNVVYSIDDGNGGLNYAVTTIGAQGSITPAPLSLAAVSDSKQYDGDTSSSAAPRANGLVGGDGMLDFTQSYDSRNAGPRILAIDPGYSIDDGNGGQNYNIIGVTNASGSITPAPLTLSAVTDTKVYDTTTGSPLTPQKSGLVSGDDISGLSQSFNSPNAGPRTLSVNPGYTIEDGNDGLNYTVTTVDASGTITPAPLTLSAVTDSKVYDRTTTSNKAPIVVNGLLGNDQVIDLTQAFDSRNAGPRQLVISGYTIEDGNNGGNYDVTALSVAGTITPAPLTLAAVTDTRVYNGGVASTDAPDETGLITGDSISGLAQVFDSRNAGPRTLSIKSGYVINDGNGGLNYAVSLTTATGAITPAPLTLSAVTDSRVYDADVDSSRTPSTGGLVTGDSVTSLSQSFDSPNAGPRTLSVNAGYVVNDGNSGLNYTVTLRTAAGTITPAPLTLSAVTDSKQYDGDTDSSGDPIVAGGLQGNDSVSGLTQAFDSRNAGDRLLQITGYAISDGNNGRNYTVTLESADGVISPAPLTLAALTDSKVYDGTTASSLTPQESGLVSGDSISGLAQVFDSRNAGDRTLSVKAGYTVNDGNGGLNYTVTTTVADGEITPAPLTLAALTDTKVYDGDTDSGLTPDTLGLVTGDSVSGLSQSFDSRNAGPRTLSVNGGYVIEDGNNGLNYTVTMTTAAGRITPAPLTLAAVSDSKVYDGDASSGLTPSADGLVGGDSVSDLAQGFDSRNAGARTLSVLDGYGINDGNGGLNYTVTLTTASGSITPAPLTLAALSDSKVYDGDTSSSLTPSADGLVGGDSVSNLAQGFDSRDAGARTLSVLDGYAINDGNGGLNYTVTLTTAAGTITPAPLTLAAVADSKVYDGDTSSSLTPSADGLVGGDSVSDLAQGFDSRNAGARTLSVLDGYAINDGNGGLNYTVTLTTAAGTITPAPLTLAAVADSKVYDGDTSSNVTPSADGLVAGDSITGLAQTFDGRNAGARTLSVLSGYAIDDGNDGGNYTVTLTTAAGTITPAPLTLSAVTDSKVYDGSAASGLAPTVGGLIDGDSVTGLAQTFDSRNAGQRTLSVLNGYSISDGNDGGNYAVTLVVAPGTITPAPLQASLVGTTFKLYDGTTVATLNASNYALSGVIGTDKVQLIASTTGAYDTPFEGTSKLVTVTSLSLTGADAGNYFVQGPATGNIGVICYSACISPTVTTQAFLDAVAPGAIYFQLPPFALQTDLPNDDDDDKDRKGDLFPVTGTGNRDLWSHPPGYSGPPGMAP